MKENRKHKINDFKGRFIPVETIEATTLIDLAYKTDMIFLELKNKAGTEISINDTSNIIKEFKNILLDNNEKLKKIAEKLGLEYNEPLNIHLLNIS